MLSYAEELISNIENVFAQEGIEWLERLPIIVADLSKFWHLQEIKPVENMTWSFVAKAKADKFDNVVIKILPDSNSFNNELEILQYFQGHGLIKLLDYNESNNTLLLPQAIPGNSLKELYTKDPELVMDHYVAVANSIFFKPYDAGYKSQHMSEWLEALDRADNSQIPDDILQKAIVLRNQLLSSAGQDFALHGDLHHDNILQHGETWVAIDPRGLVGEKEFEVSWFDFIHTAELYDNNLNIPKLYSRRVETFAKKLNLSFPRILAWSFVRLVQMSCLMIEGNCDPQEYIDTAIKVSPEINSVM